MARLSVIFARVLCLAVLMWSSLALADDQQPSAGELAWRAAYKAALQGPSDITLTDQAVLHLPSEMAFMPKTETAALMKVWGNNTDDRSLGLVIPKDQQQFWIITVDFTAEGYVKDDDAKNWNSNELLQSLKDGTEVQNKQREEMGIKALDVSGWIESPNYDAPNHRLVWSLKAVERGADAGTPAVVNYNTYALGRDGYFELDLLSSDDRVENEKRYARSVLAALEYKQGKRYEDFNSSTDHTAEYGLAALIGGVVAKKLGLLALAGVFILKFAKVILVSLAVAGGGLVKFFRGKGGNKE